jgi:hypothetical protein
MPQSRKRTKPSKALSGIHGAVLALAPREWPDARRAAWCAAYVAGAAAPQALSVPRSHQEMRVAFRLGQKQSESNKAAVAQDAKRRESQHNRSVLHERQRDAAMRGNLFARLDSMADPFGSPHDDPRLMGLAGLALGAGFGLRRV